MVCAINSLAKCATDGALMCNISTKSCWLSLIACNICLESGDTLTIHFITISFDLLKANCEKTCSFYNVCVSVDDMGNFLKLSKGNFFSS